MRMRDSVLLMLMDAGTTRFARFAWRSKHAGDIASDQYTGFLLFSFFSSLTLSVPKDAV